jgi:hypothetical protein
LIKTPLFFKYICFLGKNGFLNEKIKTKSDVYQAIIYTLLRIFLNRIGFKEEFQMDEEDVNDRCDLEIKYIEKLAFLYFSKYNNDENNHFEKLESEIKNKFYNHKKLYPRILETGVFSQFKNTFSDEIDFKNLSFQHPSLREFFSARYLLRDLKNKGKNSYTYEWIRLNKNNPDCEKILIFFAGLIKNDTSLLEFFWDAILAKPRYLQEFYDIQPFLNFLDECCQKEFKQKDELIEMLTRWLNYFLSNPDSRNYAISTSDFQGIFSSNYLVLQALYERTIKKNILDQDILPEDSKGRLCSWISSAKIDFSETFLNVLREWMSKEKKEKNWGCFRQIIRVFYFIAIEKNEINKWIDEHKYLFNECEDDDVVSLVKSIITDELDKHKSGFKKNEELQNWLISSMGGLLSSQYYFCRLKALQLFRSFALEDERINTAFIESYIFSLRNRKDFAERFSYAGDKYADDERSWLSAAKTIGICMQKQKVTDEWIEKNISPLLTEDKHSDGYRFAAYAFLSPSHWMEDFKPSEVWIKEKSLPILFEVMEYHKKNKDDFIFLELDGSYEENKQNIINTLKNNNFKPMLIKEKIKGYEIKLLSEQDLTDLEKHTYSYIWPAVGYAYDKKSKFIYKDAKELQKIDESIEGDLRTHDKTIFFTEKQVRENKINISEENKSETGRFGILSEVLEWKFTELKLKHYKTIDLTEKENNLVLKYYEMDKALQEEIASVTRGSRSYFDYWIHDALYAIAELPYAKNTWIEKNILAKLENFDEHIIYFLRGKIIRNYYGDFPEAWVNEKIIPFLNEKDEALRYAAISFLCDWIEKGLGCGDLFFIEINENYEIKNSDLEEIFDDQKKPILIKKGNKFFLYISKNPYEKKYEPIELLDLIDYEDVIFEEIKSLKGQEGKILENKNIPIFLKRKIASKKLLDVRLSEGWINKNIIYYLMTEKSKRIRKKIIETLENEVKEGRISEDWIKKIIFHLFDSKFSDISYMSKKILYEWIDKGKITQEWIKENIPGFSQDKDANEKFLDKAFKQMSIEDQQKNINIEEAMKKGRFCVLDILNHLIDRNDIEEKWFNEKAAVIMLSNYDLGASRLIRILKKWIEKKNITEDHIILWLDELLKETKSHRGFFVLYSSSELCFRVAFTQIRKKDKNSNLYADTIIEFLSQQAHSMIIANDGQLEFKVGRRENQKNYFDKPFFIEKDEIIWLNEKLQILKIDKTEDTMNLKVEEGSKKSNQSGIFWETVGEGSSIRQLQDQLKPLDRKRKI